MLKETINYEDFDGINRTDVLYFNLTKAELLDNLHLQAEFKELELTMKDRPDDQMGEVEVRKMLQLVKTFMRLSYGIRSEDGKRFAKRPEMWQEFTETASYDAYLLSLFEEPEKAVRFLVEIVPREFRPEIEAAVSDQGLTIPERPALVSVPAVAPVLANDETGNTATNVGATPELTDEQLLAMKPQDMTTEQLRRAFTLKSQ